jgi:hypothetical protein
MATTERSAIEELAVGAFVEAGELGTQDYDRGHVVSIRDGTAEVAWESGVRTSIPMVAIRSAVDSMGCAVSDAQIEALMTAAGQAGDQVQVALCLVALERDWDEDVCEDHALCVERRRGLERLGIIPEHVDGDVLARAECARVIADADANRRR